MSYDINLNDPKTGEPIPFDSPRADCGGTYCVGGAYCAHLNITYNYGWFYYHVLDKDKGIRWLYGKTGKDKKCIARLEEAVKALGTRQYKDYWAPTPGNAGYALNILLGWAKEFPEGVFDGD